LIYSNVWGPAPSSSINGHFYYAIFIDHFSKYVWLYPIKHKSNVSHICPIFKSLVENQLNTKIKTFYSNNGGKYIKLRSFFQTHRITHLTTLPYTPKTQWVVWKKTPPLGWNCSLSSPPCFFTHLILVLCFWNYNLSYKSHAHTCFKYEVTS